MLAQYSKKNKQLFSGYCSHFPWEGLLASGPCGVSAEVCKNRVPSKWQQCRGHLPVGWA